MANEPKAGLAGLVVAKIICCGALVLAASGAFSGAGAWLLDDRLVWLALFVVLVTGGLLVCRRPDVRFWL